MKNPPLRDDRPAYYRSFRTLLFALAFPVLHFFLDRLGLFDPAGRSFREGVVLVGLTVLGGSAFLQYHLLVRRAEDLWRERLEFSEQLRGSEKDLRLLLDRQKAEEEYREADERFALIFQAYPYGLSFHSLVEGKFLDANAAFERLFGYSKEEILGKTPDELGLWENREEMERVRQCLAAQKELREQRIRYRTREGEVRDYLMAVTLMDLGLEEKAWLVVVRPA